MKIVSIIFIICFIRFVHLNSVSEEAFWDFLKPTCASNISSILTIAYNRQNPYGVKNVKEQDTCNYIDSNKKVVFTVHGFLSSPNTTNMYDLASQLVKNNYSVFSVDWTEGACKLTAPYYPGAVSNTRIVGELMADYITYIICVCKVPLKNIMLIGHSLGAHASGFAAKKVKASGIGTISRIFGADPAGLLFYNNTCEERLCETDAKRVNVFHTSRKYGIYFPIGDLNLYFNDALTQPECETEFLSSVCDHKISIVYLTVLLKSSDCVFPGVCKLKNKFDQSLRPTGESANCIVVSKKMFEQDNIPSGAYYAFVDESPYCSSNKFPNCRQ